MVIDGVRYRTYQVRCCGARRAGACVRVVAAAGPLPAGRPDTHQRLLAWLERLLGWSACWSAWPRVLACRLPAPPAVRQQQRRRPPPSLVPLAVQAAVEAVFGSVGGIILACVQYPNLFLVSRESLIVCCFPRVLELATPNKLSLPPSPFLADRHRL